MQSAPGSESSTRSRSNSFHSDAETFSSRRDDVPTPLVMAMSITVPLTALVTQIDRLTENTDIWSTQRIIDEGLDIVRDHCWAVSSALYRHSDDSVVLVGHRPRLTGSDGKVIAADWFPWGLGGTNPERFMFVGNAGSLPFAEGSTETLADHGITSCAHLPMVERGRPIGYLQIHWGETRLVWNDDAGRVLRVLGRFLLGLVPGASIDVREH